MGIRSFLAFELPAPMKTVLSDALEKLKGAGLDVRWTAPANIHLTVVFLGDVAEKDIPFIEGAAGEICSRFRPFDASVNGVGIFGPRGRPRVLWAGVDGETERLALCKRELLEALKPVGLELDSRPFRPHLTLGRFRGGSQTGLDGVLKRFGDIKSDECRLEELWLFKSDLTPRGASYTVLARMPLTGGR